MDKHTISRLLPATIQSGLHPGSPLLGLLDAMEALHEPDMHILEHVDDYLDPFTAPDHFLPFLSTWVDHDWLLDELGDHAHTLTPERLRWLIAAAPDLARWRGTRLGLTRFLELATGTEGFDVSDATDRPFHIAVAAPETARNQADLITRITRAMRPAHTTFEINWQPSDLDAPASRPEEDG